MPWAPSRIIVPPKRLSGTFIGNQVRFAPEPVRKMWEMAQSDTAKRFAKAVVQHFADNDEPVDLLYDKDIDYM